MQLKKTRVTQLDKRIANIYSHTNKIKVELLYKKKSKDITNPLVFWYNSRTNKMNCHLLGELLSANTLSLLLDSCEEKLLSIHNNLFSTTKKTLSECDYMYNINSWSKQKLCEEYKKLLISNNKNKKK